MHRQYETIHKEHGLQQMQNGSKSPIGKQGASPLSVNLGEVEIEEDLSKDQLAQLDTSLKSLSFELIDDKKSQTINILSAEADRFDFGLKPT